MKKVIKALGIMNGTSLDAIDYSLIQVDKEFKKIKFIKHWQKSLPKTLKSQLLAAAQNKLTTYDLSNLHFDLGRLYGKHLKVLKKSARFDVIGLHGQTVFHEGAVATAQIGHPGFAFDATQKPVYFDFRSADVVNGGQGAPFAPFFQKIVLQQNKLGSCAFHNLGGISNLTYFKSKNSLAFDTGPANILLDAWMQKNNKGMFDKGGRLSAKGIPDPLLVNQFLKHPFFHKKPPKSTGREDFNLEMIEQWGGLAFKRLSFEDQMATLTELSAKSIAMSYQAMKSLPKKIYFYGGGVHNPYLMERIAFDLPEVEILLTDDLGWPSQAFESSTFGFLAAARYFEKKVHLPQLTGARKPQHLGCLYC